MCASLTKTIQIIARSNGVGLDSDAAILKEILLSAGYNVEFRHCRSLSFRQRLFPKKQADLNIYLERIFPQWIKTAPLNIVIPNQERYPKRHIKNLHHIDAIFCKTQHAQDVFSRQTDTPCIFSGFTSVDRSRSPRNQDNHSFLHLAGRSTLKGTKNLIQAWERHPEWPILTVIQSSENAPESVPPNVSLITEFLSTDKLTDYLNNSGVHLCPSLSEGWGHYIVEGMSCGALVLTTDAPPMNDLITPDRGQLISYSESHPRHLGTNFICSTDQIEASVEATLKLSHEEFSKKQSNAHKWYHENHRSFTKLFLKKVQTILID